MNIFREFSFNENKSYIMNSLRSEIMNMKVDKHGYSKEEDPRDLAELGYALFGNAFAKTTGYEYVLYDDNDNVLGITFDYQWIPKEKINEDNEDYEGLMDVIKIANGSIKGPTIEQIIQKDIDWNSTINGIEYVEKARPDLIKSVYKDTYIIIMNKVPIAVVFDDHGYSQKIQEFIEDAKKELNAIPNEDDFYNNYAYWHGDENPQEVINSYFSEFIKNNPQEASVWIFLQQNYPQMLPTLDITKIRQT